MDKRVNVVSPEVKKKLEIKQKRNNLIIHGIREDPLMKDLDVAKYLLEDGM